MINLYNTSVPTFQRYISNLAVMLDKIPRDNEADFLSKSIAPDMRPLWQQVLMTLGFALRATAPLAGLTTPQLNFQAKNLCQLQQDIEQTQAFLAQLTVAQFDHADALIINHQAGLAVHDMTASVYLHQYALPNFFFHLTCVYAILRQHNLPLSKGDFDGFHQYNA